ncbi:MAG: gamma-glutamyl-gamma-aminobutyrate hydrolase family protein [Candidatus Binataceae bacterium]
MSKIWVLQHHPVENLGSIAEALESAALAWQYVRTFDGHPVPRDMKGAGGLIVMGGPMGVYEHQRYPFLSDEMRLIEGALAEGKPVLGVCLGSQLLAATLGAKVSKGDRKEIGWYPVRLASAARDDRLFGGVPESFVALHWHGDVFELPRNATALASSERTPIQAFRHGDNAYGLLFHVEVNAAIVAGLVREFAAEVDEAGADGARIIAQAGERLHGLAPIAETVFGRWAAPIHA